VTRSFHPAHSRPAAGHFRPADHVLVVPQGSAVTILDLEQGDVYATTPFGTEVWRRLVSGATPPHRTVAEGRRGSGPGKGNDPSARIADYLLDRRLIEPVARGAGNYRGASPIR